MSSSTTVCSGFMAVKSLHNKCHAGRLQGKDKVLIGRMKKFSSAAELYITLYPRENWHLLKHIENLYVADG